MKKILFYLLCMTAGVFLYAGETARRPASASETIDSLTFYPHFILRHTMDDFYKLPKNPVFSGGRGNWDQQDVADPFITVNADSVILWYDGSRGGGYGIGRAVLDADGWAWQRLPKVLAPQSDWHASHVIAPAFIPGRSHSFIFCGNASDSELGYRLGFYNGSVQPLKWAQNPPQWDADGRAYATVIRLSDGRGYRMYYTGFSGPLASISMAESRDGHAWIAHGTPLFSQNMGAIAPFVMYNGREYIMYYATLRLDHGFYTELRRARSRDGIRWQEDSWRLQPSEKWEGKRLMRPHISYFDGVFHLYYCAQRGSRWRVGEARAAAVFERQGRLIFHLRAEQQVWRISYEASPGSRVTFQLKKAASDVSREPETEVSGARRNGAFHTKLTFEARAGEQLHIVLESTNGTVSPVIYKIERLR